jgi:hypothetical protein
MNFTDEPTSFVNRFLMSSGHSKIPHDPKKLRISAPALRILMSHIDPPLSFISSFCRYYQPPGKGFRRNYRLGLSESFDVWYILPLRVQVECTNSIAKHSKSAAGSNQMDPFNYLHLENEKLDIRGSQIGILFKYNFATCSTTTVSMSLQDGRWSRVVKEPQRRIEETIERLGYAECEEDPFFVHVVVMTSALRWWRNALDSFNNQLIAHVSTNQCFGPYICVPWQQILTELKGKTITR